MLSDVGRVRSHNEDSCGFSTSRANGSEPEDSLLLVADGMGGHAAGEVASRLAVDVMRRAYFVARGPVPSVLASAVHLANQAILEYAAANMECAGMGTTCTALAVRQGLAFLAHVGDSRAYLLRSGRLTQLSNDQTLVAKLVRDGALTADEARHSEHRNVILQALGTQPRIEPEIWGEGLPLVDGDVLVLCTDGLHGLIEDPEIADLAAGLPPEEACRALIERACEAGGDDNISVGVFRVEHQPALRSDQRSTRPIAVPADLRVKRSAETSVSTADVATVTRRP
jgi:PPM family protein phosphatase